MDPRAIGGRSGRGGAAEPAPLLELPRLHGAPPEDLPIAPVQAQGLEPAFGEGREEDPLPGDAGRGAARGQRENQR